MEEPVMPVSRIFVITLILAVLLVPMSAQAKSIGTSVQSVAGVTCNLPESDAEALVILSNYYPNRYWWDHTDLTIAVQAHPSTSDEYLDALHAAIATWSDVLSRCFDGLITLTDVTDSVRNPQEADI